MLPGREQTRPPLLLLNPLGTLPILVDGELVLRDASAILAYLAHQYDPPRQFLPEAPAAFGQVMMWLGFATTALRPAAAARAQALFDTPASESRPADAARDAFRVMDDHMTARGFAAGAWFVGDAPTLADIALYPAIALSRDYGIDHEEYPALRGWMRRVRALPGFVTMPGIPNYQ